MSTPNGTRAFPACTSQLHSIRRFIREEAESSGVSSDVIGDLIVAASEACANAALHTESEEVWVTWVMADGRIEISVEDGGVFTRSIPFPEAESMPRAGRGIPLMMALMDEVTIREGSEDEPGTLIKLVKYAA